MEKSLNLDLIDFHKPKDKALFNGSSDKWQLFMTEWSAKARHGEYAVIRQLDLSGCNLNHFPADRIVFVQCNLDGALFRNTHFEFETAFINCSIKNADLTDTLASDALFINCDLTGIKISAPKPYTRWTSDDLDSKTIVSIFDGCKLDDQTKQFLIDNKCLVDGTELTQEQRFDVAVKINDKLYRIITAPILDL